MNEHSFCRRIKVNTEISVYIAIFVILVMTTLFRGVTIFANNEKLHNISYFFNVLK